jgi:hypothetical protein
MRPYQHIETETLQGMIEATRKALRFAEQLNLTSEEQGDLNRMLNLLLDELQER